MDESSTPIMPRMEDSGEGKLVPPEKFPVPHPANPNSYDITPVLQQLFQAPDYGADSHYRFRYQAACAAIYALPLLDADATHAAVYCELLEDILIEFRDGSLCAVQVKTRDKGLDPFKTVDSEILAALGRFSDYEHEAGTRFSRYLMASNCGFWHASREWRNVEHLKKVAAASTCDDLKLLQLSGQVVAAIEKRHKRTVTDKLMAIVLKKLFLHGTLPECGAERSTLHKDLRRYVANVTVDEMELITNDIVDFVCSMGSREHEDRTGTRAALAIDPMKSTLEMRLSSKRITAEALRKRLEQAVMTARLVVRSREKSDLSASRETDKTAPAFENQQRIQSVVSELMMTITTLVEQLEWQKASNEVMRMLVWLKGNEMRLASSSCFEAYMLAGSVEGEMARRESGAVRDTHLQTARTCLEKAGLFNGT